MGFDVTAANIIFFIAFLAVGSAAVGAYWHNSGYVEGARRIEDSRSEDVVHTSMSIATAQYNGGLDRFTVEIQNTGATVLAISALGYLIDGEVIPSSAIVSAEIPAATSPTDLWLPRETLEVVFGTIDPSPTYFQIVAENGVVANWVS